MQQLTLKLVYQNKKSKCILSTYSVKEFMDKEGITRHTFNP